MATLAASKGAACICSPSARAETARVSGAQRSTHSIRAAPASARLAIKAARTISGTRARATRDVRVFASAEASKAIAVTDQTFEEKVLKSSIPVLVDFWAPWCGPCRMIAPLIDELSDEYAGKILTVKLNTDESPGVATQYGIRSIPTVMIFKGGEKMDTVIGAVPKSTLTQTIEKYL